MRVAAIQMNSGPDVEANLQLADLPDSGSCGRRCAACRSAGKFCADADKGRDKSAHAESVGSGPIQDFLAAASRQHKMWIVAGSMPLASPEPDRVYGACPVYDASGEVQACYRKIHLFDVKLPDLEESYQESWSMYPGDKLVCVDTPIGRIGLAICYDMRFPGDVPNAGR